MIAGARKPRARAVASRAGSVRMAPTLERRGSSQLTAERSSPQQMLQFSMSCDGDELRPLASPSPCESLEREVERGNVEYKLKMIDPSAARLQQLVTQLKWRLAEGAGEALYEIGVADNGTLAGLDGEDMAASLETLRRMSVEANAKMSVLRRRAVGGGMAVCEVLMQTLASSEKTELRVACIGGTQAGKSTLVAVLSAGTLDNGHGSARTSVMRHPHELESGSTSCISQQVLGFDAQVRAGLRLR